MDTRGRNTWHTTEPWHNSPPPGRRVPRHNSPTGEGGWALWRPLRTDMDRNTGRGPPERNKWLRPWRSWELRRPWRCRELRRPWRCRELRRPWRCRDLRRPWQVVFHGHGLLPRPGHSSRNPSTPPKISLGKLGGIRSPPGLDRQDSTGQPSGARQTGQDIPQEQEALLGELGSWGFLWAWRWVRGPHRVPQQPLPLLRQGGKTSLRGQDKTRLD